MVWRRVTVRRRVHVMLHEALWRQVTPALTRRLASRHQGIASLRIHPNAEMGVRPLRGPCSVLSDH